MFIDVSFPPMILLVKIKIHFENPKGLEMALQSDKQVKISCDNILT
jgi:hypothetical protein